jgi:hypothetical protein
LLSILRRVTDAGAKFKSLKDPWADTTTPHAELMVTILAGLATFERHLIKARTDEGRTRAKARGVRFGRPPKMTLFQRQEALQRLANGESQADLARAYNSIRRRSAGLRLPPRFDRNTPVWTSPNPSPVVTGPRFARLLDRIDPFASGAVGASA